MKNFGGEEPNQEQKITAINEKWFSSLEDGKSFWIKELAKKLEVEVRHLDLPAIKKRLSGRLIADKTGAYFLTKHFKVQVLEKNDEGSFGLTQAGIEALEDKNNYIDWNAQGVELIEGVDAVEGDGFMMLENELFPDIPWND